MKQGIESENPRFAERGFSGQSQSSQDSSFNYHAKQGLIANLKPQMADVLKRLKVAFNARRPASWQDVKCPCCDGRAVALLRGGFNGEGRFRCFGCGLHGDSIKVYQTATNTTFRQACFELGCWGVLP